MAKLRSISTGFWSDPKVDIKYRYNIEPLTIKRILSFNDDSFSHFRKSSTSYANRVYVRNYVFEKYNNCCFYCGCSENLQVDHVISVRKCFDDREFMKCNTLDNLQLLCFNCNNKKSNHG